MSTAGGRCARTGLLAAATMAAASLTICVSAQAATFPVTKLTDSADGACNADCSLREAVIAANAAPGADLIVLGPGRHELTIPGAGEDAAATGDLDIKATDGVDIRGAGEAATTIDANELDRILDVDDDVVELRRLTLTGGNAGVANGGAVLNTNAALRATAVRFEQNEGTTGGAIYSTGMNTPQLRLERASFLGNTASGPLGGGAIWNQEESQATITESSFEGNLLTDPSPLGGGAIFNQNEAAMVIADTTFGPHSSTERAGAIYNQNHAVMTITDSLIEGATAGGDGGAVFTHNDATLTIIRSVIRDSTSATHGGAIAASNSALVTVIDSTLANNSATSGDLVNDGGGGVHLRFEAQLIVLRSTLSGNTTAANGGAIAIGDAPSSARASVLNSTLSDNTAAAEGGGLYVEADGGATLENSTVASNAAAIGGGIANAVGSPFAIEAASSIIADNSATVGGHQCSAAIASLGANVDSGTECGFTAAGDLQAAVAALAPLAENGGPTRTRALGAGSDAIDAGGADCLRAADQRGVARPQAGACDVGAFELVQAFGADPLVRFAKLPRKLDRKGRARLTLVNENPFAVSAKVTLAGRKGPRLGGKRVQLAGGEKKKLRLKVSKRGRKAVARPGRLKARATAALTDPSGNKTRVKKNFKLK